MRRLFSTTALLYIGLTRLEKSRKRQGIVVKFMVYMPGESLPGGGGGARSMAMLAELNTLPENP